jgi:transposase
MRTQGTPAELEHRRRLAVHRVLDGLSLEEVADFLGVEARSVRRWMQSFRRHGWAGLAADRPCGRPGKLSRTQEKIVLRWLADPATDFGFPTELWTAARIAELIEDEWGITFNARYLPCWLKARGYSCQKPERVPRERNEEVIAAWVAEDWPRLKKKRGENVRA